jgi:hypothetical protein
VAEPFDTARRRVARFTGALPRVFAVPPAPVAAICTAGLVALDPSSPGKRLIMCRAGGPPAIARVAADG